MYRVRYLLVIICLFMPSAYAEKIKVMVGVPSFYSIKKEIHESSTHKFFFKSDDYNFRLLNNYLTKKIDIAILPPEYLLKAAWGAEETGVIFKTFPHYVYLMSAPGSDKISKSNIKGKTILVRSNSQEEFYLRRFAGQDKIVILKAPMKLVEEAIDAGFIYQGQRVDVIVVDAENYYKNRKKSANVSYIKAGNYYGVTFLQNNWLINPKENNEIFKKLFSHLGWANKIDAKELVEINEFLLKKASAQRMFKIFYQDNLKEVL